MAFETSAPQPPESQSVPPPSQWWSADQSNEHHKTFRSSSFTFRPKQVTKEVPLFTFFSMVTYAITLTVTGSTSLTARPSTRSPAPTRPAASRGSTSGRSWARRKRWTTPWPCSQVGYCTNDPVYTYSAYEILHFLQGFLILKSPSKILCC